MHNHIKHHNQADHHLLDHFYVVTAITNPIRFHSRYQLYRDFAARMEAANIKLLTIEVAYGERKHKITHSDNPMHVQLQTSDEIWHKENALNIGISRLPSDWKYVAWIDADVEFVRPDWALETVHQLQHHMIVQMFQTAVDLGPSDEVINTHRGFAWSYVTGQPYPWPTKYYTHWHPGFGWSARREAIDALGGLIDFAILGAGDHHMASCLIGKGAINIPKAIGPNYRKMILDWEQRAELHIKRDIGYVPGTLLHHWHGKKKDRRYQDRWQILTRNHYDPMVDIKRDWQGLFTLNNISHEFRDQVRMYFRNRMEDSIDNE